MIVKFFRRSKEQGSKPINYFLGAEKDREFARVLSGDPVITEHLINATKYENKYTSGVLAPKSPCASSYTMASISLNLPILLARIVTTMASPNTLVMSRVAMAAVLKLSLIHI